MTTQPSQPPIRVLMLGWEFPPFITGGLGTACYGLTRAMHRRGMKVSFVLPKAADSSEEAEHVALVTPPRTPDGGTVRYEAAPVEDRPADAAQARTSHRAGSPHADVRPPASPPAGSPPDPSTPSSGASLPADPDASDDAGDVEFIEVPADFHNPYQREPGDRPVGRFFATPPRENPHDPADPADSADPGRASAPFSRGAAETAGAHSTDDRTDGAAERADGDEQHPSPSDERSRDDAGESGEAADGSPPPAPPAATDYQGDLFDVVEQYARFCAVAVRDLDFDIIHAHDWMTYAAGLRIARLTGKPLVVHVHSTEFDRAGEHINHRIYDIERRGTHGAIRVCAVSQLTKNILINRYGLRDRQVEVVYNGVDLEPRDVGMTGIRSRDRIVLYFGRITYQKGPEYFMRAAKRVLEVMDDVKFVVAGSGDMAKRMIEMAAELGIGHKVLFTGFLRGKDIQRVFSMADLYVMPSVSEPFGIAPLEAMSNDVPALISRTSGVSEILRHALKVDFWDVDDIANKIVAVLKYPPLQRTLREHGAFEVRRLTWDGAAERCEQIYRDVLREMRGPGTSPLILPVVDARRPTLPTNPNRA